MALEGLAARDGGDGALFVDGEDGAGVQERGGGVAPPRVEAERAAGLLEVAALRRWRRRCSFSTKAPWAPGSEASALG